MYDGIPFVEPELQRHQRIVAQLRRENASLKREIEQLTASLELLRNPPRESTPLPVKPGWSLPESPMCCGKPTHAVAHHDGDVFEFFHECEVCCDVKEAPEIQWPFDAERATDRDMQNAGFVVV